MTYAGMWHRVAAVLVLCALQAAGGIAMPTSMSPSTTSTTASSQWPSLLETARLFVSRWLNETAAIVAIGVGVGLAAASFAVLGLDWKDYNDRDHSDRLIIEQEHEYQVLPKQGDI
jgi:hypothetical protein